MAIEDQKVVKINYELKNDSGEVLDKSAEGEPLAYLHGANNIIPGLETALTGKAEGEKVDVEIEPGEAYGERQEELVQAVPMSAFEGVDKVEPGMRFTARGPQGQQVVTVTEVADDEVTVDANHPLAGEKLHFNVEVVEVRDASPEEVEHGHVHDGSEQH